MHLEPSAPLAPHCTLGIGGPAQYLATARTESEVGDAVRWARERQLPLRVLGGGSNLVVGDEGVAGVVLRPELKSIERQADGDTVRFTVGAGEVWDDFVRLTVTEGCQGLECLAGIPGRVGATPIQNVGAYGQEVSECIEAVRVLDRESLTVSELPAEACAFGYRDSLFKSGLPERYVVLAVTFRLRRGAPPKLAYGELRAHFGIDPDAPPRSLPSLEEVRAQVVELRRKKSMVLDPTDPNRRSCGSFFVNAIVSAEDVARITRVAGEAPPAFAQPDGRYKVPSAWLIERAGLHKGTRRGPVGLSTKHTLALVAHDGARASDVLDFAHFVRRAVHAHFGLTLIPEPDFWGFERSEARLPLPTTSRVEEPLGEPTT